MKITPIAGPNMGSADVSSSAVPQSRREAAKQAFMGAPVTQTEEPATKESLIAALKVPRIKMRTNVSPDRMEEEEVAQESAIPESTEAVESEVTRPISPQFAALAKQRRALQVKEREIAEKERALEQRSSQPSLDLERLKGNPLGLLKEAGISYEQLTEALLAEQSGQDPRVQALEAKIEALEKGLDTKLSDRDAQAETQVLAEMRRETDRLTASGEDFEMVRETRSQPKVVDLIHRTWKTTGEVMDVQEATQLIEEQLVEDYSKLANFGKIRSRLSPQEQTQDARVPQNRQTGIRTLTNRDTASRPLSARARAMAAFSGTLKR